MIDSDTSHAWSRPSHWQVMFRNSIKERMNWATYFSEHLQRIHVIDELLSKKRMFRTSKNDFILVLILIFLFLSFNDLQLMFN